MAVNVNPPPFLRLPPEFLKDKQTRAFIEQQNTIIFQLWNRLGGGTDEIDTIQQNITRSSSINSATFAKVSSLELKAFEVISTTADLTTSEFQIIICKNTASINIILDPKAIENDEVHIKRRGGEINVIGSIDGVINKLINVPNYSMHLVFDGTDWSEI